MFSESNYPGIGESIRLFDEAKLPECPRCQSEDTASVQVGIIGRTLAIARSTAKFHLVANGSKLGRYFCNTCRTYWS